MFCRRYLPGIFQEPARTERLLCHGGSPERAVSRPGKSANRACDDSANGSLRDKSLPARWFSRLRHAQGSLAVSTHGYVGSRPPWAPSHLTPRGSRAQWARRSQIFPDRVLRNMGALPLHRQPSTRILRPERRGRQPICGAREIVDQPFTHRGAEPAPRRRPGSGAAISRTAGPPRGGSARRPF